MNKLSGYIAIIPTKQVQRPNNAYSNKYYNFSKADIQNFPLFARRKRKNKCKSLEFRMHAQKRKEGLIQDGSAEVGGSTSVDPRSGNGGDVVKPPCDKETPRQV